jgi:hypothetical protein
MLIKDIPKIMAICLGITIVIEVIFAYLFKVRDKKDLLNIVLANIITNPVIVTVTILINYKFGSTYYYISLVILEILVVIVEGLLYKKYLCFNKINPFLLSMLLNILSYVSGEIFWRCL